MICDRIENLAHYKAQCPDIEAIAAFLAANDAASLAPGSYEINDDVFVNVEEYAPGDNELYEAHRDRTDLQYLVAGDEEIACIAISDGETYKDYDPSIDAGFYKEAEGAAVFRLYMQAGAFAIFEPHDLHSPGRKYKADHAKKLIFKIKVR